MPKRASAKEVAELAKVSRTTVSFAHNNVPGMCIGEETRPHMFEAAPCTPSRLLPTLHSTLPTPNPVVPADDRAGLDQRNVRSALQAFEQSCGAWKAVALCWGPFLNGFSPADNPEHEARITTKRNAGSGRLHKRRWSS